MGETVVAGIPIPSTSLDFLAGVGIHVAFGLASTAAALLAIFSRKGPGRHRQFGEAYFWSLAGVFVTASALAVARWSEDGTLFALAVLAFGSALFGRWARRQGRLRAHIAAMGVSFVTLLTAFYVDNGKSLPVWRSLPPIAYWTVPSLIGAPIILAAMLRHPLVRRRWSNRPGPGSEAA
jgi:hypothetical protein